MSKTCFTCGKDNLDESIYCEDCGNQLSDENGAYSAEISRKNPGAFLFLIDQSGSMTRRNEFDQPLSIAVADSINRLLQNLIIKCSKAEGVRDYFDVGVIGYGDGGCYNGFKGYSGSNIFRKISEINDTPYKIEERKKKIPDGAGGIIEHSIKFPVWFEPVASGTTPMCEAFKIAAQEAVQWCENHIKSFPPIIINITDGEPTDGDPEDLTDMIKDIKTANGGILIFNAHITIDSKNEYLFVNSESVLPNDSAKKLFRMSSCLTPTMQDIAVSMGYQAQPGAKGYVYNAGIESLIEFLDIGTRAGNLR